MTPEESIKIIHNMISDDIAVYGNKYKSRNEALNLALNALNSMEDICEAMNLEYDGWQILRYIKQICDEYKGGSGHEDSN